MGDLEYCEKCSNRLEPDRTYHIHTNEPLSKAICSKCHDDYCRLMEMLHSEYGTIGEEQITLVRDRITKWFYSDGGNVKGSLKNAKLTFCGEMASLLEGLGDTEAFMQWIAKMAVLKGAHCFEFWSELEEQYEAEAIECMEQS